jgi:hypothetical protein
MPPILDAPEWYAWADPGCEGDRVHSRTFAPPTFPHGTSIVRVASDDPDYDGALLMRAEEAGAYYWRGPSHDGACELGSDSVVPKPWHRWPKLDATAFVRGTLESE